MSYWKIYSPKLAAEICDVLNRRKFLIKEAKRLGQKWGGTPMYSKFLGLSFWCFSFSIPKPTDLWIKPDKQGYQRPRTLNKKSTQAHKDLAAEWDADMSYLRSLSVDQQAVWMTINNFCEKPDGGFADAEGWVYFESILIKESTDGVVEILGSEYQHAKANQA